VPVYIPEDSVASVLQSESPFIKLSEGDSTTISASSLQEIRESGKVLEIELPNGLVIRIDGATITDNAVSLNIYVEITITDIATVVNDVQLPANSIIIAPSTHGEFGFTKSFDISAEKLAEAGLNGENVRLFHISADGTVTEQGSVRLNDDGSVTISISHASQYLLAEIAPVSLTAAGDTPIIDNIPDTPASDAASPAEPVSPAVQNISTPQSGNGSNTILWILAGIAAAIICGIAIIAITRRRQRV